MHFQWYPGHMTKARRMMQEDIKLIDLVIELVDARVPSSSRNPDIDELAKNKARLILLNKSDLAEERMNDVKSRYGYYPQDKWDRNMALKEYFEKKMGKDLYTVVPMKSTPEH